jgi:hypothetical protein
MRNWVSIACSGDGGGLLGVSPIISRISPSISPRMKASPMKLVDTVVLGIWFISILAVHEIERTRDVISQDMLSSENVKNLASVEHPGFIARLGMTWSKTK